METVYCAGSRTPTRATRALGEALLAGTLRERKLPRIARSQDIGRRALSPIGSGGGPSGSDSGPSADKQIVLYLADLLGTTRRAMCVRGPCALSSPHACMPPP